MFSVFEPAKRLTWLSRGGVRIDNSVFQLHYRVTLAMLLICSLLVTSRQYIGDPIDCMVDDVPNGVMDTYCWIHSTFSVPGEDNELDLLYTGVRPQGNREQLRFHKYYQWVCFALFGQAMLFYLPRYIWKVCENNKMQILVQDLHAPIVEEDIKQDRLRLLTEYFANCSNKNHKGYALKFFLCETLNLANVLAQIYFMDAFLGGQFSKYGMEVLAISEQEASLRTDPMARVFPKVAKCTLHKFGASGTMERYDGLCVLPLNIINEKIYIAIWLWFTFITAITALHLVYRLFVMAVPSMRTMLMQSTCRLADGQKVDHICSRMGVADWFVLHLLAKNVDPLTMRQLVNQLFNKMHEA